MSFSNVAEHISSITSFRWGRHQRLLVRENQLGVELMDTPKTNHTRYAASMISSSNGAWAVAGRTYDGYLHLSQAFMAGGLGLQRVVRTGRGIRPTYFETSGPDAAPSGNGIGNALFYRAGCTEPIHRKFDLTAFTSTRPTILSWKCYRGQRHVAGWCTRSAVETGTFEATTRTL